MEIFREVLNKMPVQFSTNQFIDKLRKLKVDEYIIKNEHHVGYLKKHCYSISKRTYVKKENNQSSNNKTELHLTEEICIQFLKEKGYKILKPTFTEL